MTDVTAELFDWHADTYRADVERSIGFTGLDLDFFTRAKADELVGLVDRFVGSPGALSILDVGCGPGVTDELLAPRFRTLTGVDTSPEMVIQAAARNPGATYEAYDGCALPFSDDAFDVTFAICVMHHVPPPQWDAFVAEMHRVTRPGGLVLVFEHNPFNPLTRRAVDRCTFDEDAVLLSPRRVRSACDAGGGRVVASRYVLFVPGGGRRTRTAERLLGRCPLGAQYVVAARP